MNLVNHIESLSDTELVSIYRGTSDDDFIVELFRRYTHLVFGVCMKYLKNEVDAEDAVMQIFENLMNDLKRHSVVNFKGWLYSVAKNHCLMQLRGEKHRLQKYNELKNDYKNFVETSYNMHLDGENEKEKTLTDLEEAIKELNEEQKICIEIFYLKEMCYAEVADLTGFTINQVKSYIQNGKRNLKINLEKKNERQIK